MPMIDCSGVAVGVDSLACISSQTDYVLGYVLLVLLVAVLFYRMNFEPTRERVASILLVVSIMVAMGATKEMLFPSHFYVVAVVLFIGSAVMLAVRK